MKVRPTATLAIPSHPDARLAKAIIVTSKDRQISGRHGVRARVHVPASPETTPAANAPPLLIQEGSFKDSPPQMRRGGALGDGVVLNRKRKIREIFCGNRRPVAPTSFSAAYMARSCATKVQNTLILWRCVTKQRELIVVKNAS
jgi:hypothetical protein